MALKHLRSSTANKRPLPSGLADGQLAVNTEQTSPGLFFKNASGSLVKVGPVHVGATAPNATPASGGETGNTIGEQWLDTSVSPSQLKTWNGSAWVSDFPDEIPVSKLADGAARQLLQTDAAGTGVEWTSNVDIPGTLDVTGAAVFDSTTSATGSSTAASFIPSSSTVPTNGVYLPAANTVGLATNGAQRVTVDSSGRLLVGSPSASGDALLQVNGGYNLLKGFNRRPPLHRGSLFYKTAAATISVVANCSLNGFFYSAATAVTMPGSHTNNTDYAIWQHPTTGALVADASFTTAPAGATGGSIVGGYHRIPSGRPTAFNNGSPTSTAEILEFSLWDLTWRPACPDPRGMACIEGGFWADLYLCGATSYAGSTFSAVPSSRIGLTIADGSSPPLVPAQYGGNGSTAYANGKWYVFAEVARSFGKRLPLYSEFAAATFGAPEASSRGSDPGTVQWERVSKFGLAQATGVLWSWAEHSATTTQPAAWTTGTETDGRGQVYGAETRALLLGGSWNAGSNSGSRCAAWNVTPWNSDADFGARFVAGHLVLG